MGFWDKGVTSKLIDALLAISQAPSQRLLFRLAKVECRDSELVKIASVDSFITVSLLSDTEGQGKQSMLVFEQSRELRR